MCKNLTEEQTMQLRNFKIWLVALSIALISACGSQDSGSSSANAVSQTSSKSANIASTSLLDSLDILYPKGQMSEQQKALAAKELLQNPAALRKTAPASVSINSQSASSNVKAQVATGNFGPVYRIQNTTLSGSYFFTIYDGERDSALALHPEWNLEGTAFYTSRVAAPGLSPVHRFQNKLNGSYLYTIYEAERADIVANYSDFFAYEGVSWHASQTAEAGYKPLYRFRNKLNGTYLFSSYESEKDAIIANYADIFELEGIAYYVRQTDPLELSLLAGGLGGYGNLDGVGSEARLGYSNGVAVDAAGNAFVADGSNTSIRKITPSGQVTTFAGGSYGVVDGTGTAAKFASPAGIVIDSAGNLFVADQGSRSIRKITTAAVVTTFAGSTTFNPTSTAVSVDGTGTAATFRSVSGLAIDSADNLYVADTNNYTIRKITPAGVVTTIAGDVTGTYPTSGPVNGPALSARFVFPRSITVDSANNIYVAESSQIRKIAPDGMVSTFAGQALGGIPQDGVGSAAVFSGLIAIKADTAGNVFAIEGSLYRDIRKITPAGVVTTFAGVLTNTSLDLNPVDGTGAAARFGNPTALTVDATGNLLVMDSGTLRKVTPSAVVTTLVGKSAQTGSTDGTGAAARFLNMNDMVVDSTGNIFALSMLPVGNNYVVRKISAEGVVTTFAGGGSFSFNPSGDGTGTSAAFYFAAHLAIDAANNLYVTEQGVVRKITPAGVVTTIAGVRPTTGTVTPVDGTGAAARFTYLGGIAADSTGNLFVSEGRNIRKITPAAVVTTFANIPTTSTTYGPSLSKIAIDSTDTLYVVDSTKIQKVTSSAVVSTFAGAAGGGYADGDISIAKFSYSAGIAFDAANNLYMADGGNNVVRKITAAGQVSTVVGTAKRVGVVEGLLSGAANLANPNKVGVYGGKLYITDENSILKVNGLP
jgi:sugar lactone lactonase YvrE